MLILLTNDDGVYAPGLAAIERELRRLGEVCVVAPATEQSGVGHSITYLTPLIVKEVYQGETRWGWAVEGSPADCVKIGITELCPRQPDLIVSGINGGLNAGINVLYSGTVAAAIEGAFFGVTSVAVSLQFDEHARFDKAARLVRRIIEQILDRKGPEPQLYNMNIPTTALGETPAVSVVPMDVTRYGDRYEKRIDPWGREYYWITGAPPVATEGHETDLSALAKGHVTLTPLDYNMTRTPVLAAMQPWQFDLGGLQSEDDSEDDRARGTVVRTQRRMQQVVPSDQDDCLAGDPESSHQD
ncbi:MAG: 5'/3'-nucleotidase SurE [Pirellulales bacterium]|nr:5'/3'-nucleotidase SurE [Pirellulales bacterium]